MKHLTSASSRPRWTAWPLAALLSAACTWAPSIGAQTLDLPPATPSSAAPAAAPAAGVPASEINANAPERYTVKTGDTLWAISGLYLKSPWRWPQLWGMNKAQIRNPHWIYPGQVLVLERNGDMVRLSTEGSNGGRDDTTPIVVKLSPRTRYESLSEAALPTLASNLIEPFLAEPLILDETALLNAPRIAATQENRVMITRGDRAYATGTPTQPLKDTQLTRVALDYRVFREATPLKDPITNEVLGYEAQYVGQAKLARPESSREYRNAKDDIETVLVPATIDIVSAKEEMRPGDRLQPEPQRQLRSYTPHAPDDPIEARVVSIYGSAVRFASQNQVIVINKGTRDGVEVGHVLSILSAGERIVDRSGERPRMLQLPDERVGMVMVFRPFERLSYALVLQVTDSVKVGDRLTNPN